MDVERGRIASFLRPRRDEPAAIRPARPSYIVPQQREACEKSHSLQRFLGDRDNEPESHVYGRSA